ncbi:hypothetical protein HK098_006002 [Nowakowskiella sp. JEL0407]|nr:hypothetical protein HK098_006002 [Nowakowskiella sp. JEL0407]
MIASINYDYKPVFASEYKEKRYNKCIYKRFNRSSASEAKTVKKSSIMGTAAEKSSKEKNFTLKKFKGWVRESWEYAVADIHFTYGL